MKNDQPYLSIVAASRNDDHGGDPLRRTQIFLNSFCAQCEKYRLRGEIILVEWNPPADRPSLAEVLDLSKANAYCEVRVITVPPELHRRLQHAHKMPFFQMIAKNVGIRRAKGDFILATNIDILFSDELIAWIARRELDPEKMYRVDRIDVDSRLPSDASPEEQLQFCLSNAIRLHRLGESLDQFETRRFLDRHRKLPPDEPWDGSFQTLPREAPYSQLHTNGCGDFTLLSRQQWNLLRGYPEFEIFSMHIDSIFCCQAHYAGAGMTVLPFPCVAFHIEHSKGSGWTPEGAGILFERLKCAGIPALDFPETRDLLEIMRVNGSSFVFNSESWGFADCIDESSNGFVRLQAPSGFWPSGALHWEMSVDRIRAEYFASAFRESELECKRLRTVVEKRVDPAHWPAPRLAQLLSPLAREPWAKRSVKRWLRSIRKRLPKIQFYDRVVSSNGNTSRSS